MEEVIQAGVVGGMYVHEIAPDAPEAERKAWVRDRVAFIRAAGPSREFRNFDGRWLQARERRSRAGNLVCVRTDITKLKEAMQELETARDAAQAAAEAKSRFLARMGHELRTPLNAIIGFGELLEGDASLGAEQREQVRVIAESGRHLLDLINDLLDLSKIEAGRIELADRSFELPALLASVAEFMRLNARRKRIDLRVELAADLPCNVRGDPTRVRQIVLNLLSNAVKFTPAGGSAVLRACRAPSAAPAGDKTLVRIEVEDSGPGIPRDRLGLLFREFERITPSLEPGTGLGLAISARLVEAMGGRIGCDSEVGRGSRFWLEIPFTQVESISTATTPARGAEVQAASLRVLVVDDVAANRALAQTLLRAAGHHVELARDGEEAVAAVEGGEFDLVLMDVQMPGVDGLEATRRIRALPPPRGRVPIIALTAAPLPEHIEQCLRVGMDGHIAKPIRRDELLEALAGPGRMGRRGAEEELMRRALAELEEELGEATIGLLTNVVGEFRLGRETLAEGIGTGEVPPTLRQTLPRLSAGGRMVGADRLAAASDHLAAVLDVGGDWREAIEAALSALDEALPWLEARLAAGDGHG
jgi:signal transduction histidine kinase/DNA-binding NarL/FixJ family response regulator